MRETSVIAPTAPCGRADPSAFYGDPDLPHLAAPSQASECHWHRSYHRDSSLTQAMALPSVPISEPTWLPNNIVRCGRSVLGGDGHRRTAHYIVSWCNGSQTCTPLPPSSPHGVDMRLVLPRRSLDVGVAQPLHFSIAFLQCGTLLHPGVRVDAVRVTNGVPRRPRASGFCCDIFFGSFGLNPFQGATDERSLRTMRGSADGRRLDGREHQGGLAAVISIPAAVLQPEPRGWRRRFLVTCAPHVFFLERSSSPLLYIQRP